MAPGASLWRPFRPIADHPIAASLVFVLVVSAVFLGFPGLDLWASELFYRARGGFFLRHNDLLTMFRSTGDIAVIVVVAVLIAQLAVRIARPGRPSLIAPNVTLFLLSSLVLGPLLLVNVVLKDHWGRPRPVAVDAFGGEAPYVEVWRITDYCVANCSFVAGEASTAAWLFAAALLLPRRIRGPAAIAVFVYAVLLSLNRIAFGGHFLSDVLLSWGLTLLVMAVLYRIVIERPPAWLSNDALEAGLGCFGRALRPAGGKGTS